MDQLPVGFSILSFLMVMSSWVYYFSTIPKMKVPVEPWGSVLIQLVGVGVAVHAISQLVKYPMEGVIILSFIPSIFALLMGLIFFWLLSMRKTPVGDLKVNVGDRILPFKTSDSDGFEFHTDQLAGKRILFKFFRGGW